MFHNSCYVVLDLAVVPNPLLYYQKTPNHTIILSYHQIIIEAILQMHFPENGTRHFSKNFDKRPGEIAFHNGFRYKSWDVWPNSPKSGMWISSCLRTMNHPLWERRIIFCGDDEFPSVGTTNDLLWQRGMIFVGNKE